MSGSTDGPGVAGRLFRGYGPLLGFAAMFLAISLIVPTQSKEVVIDQGAAAGAGALEFTDPSTEVASETTVPVDPAAAAAAAAAGTGAGATGSSKPGSSKPGTAAKKAGVAAAGSNAPGAPGSIAGCGDFQVKGDPYSPPCLKWKGGDNGGATSKGVTKDRIKVAVRIQAYENGVADALSKVAKATIPNESSEKIENTIRGLTDYFNKYYEFYGRKLDLTIYKGKGQLEREILGGGSEGATSDALKVATEIGAFADTSAASPPYADALTRQKVVNIGAPYISRDYFSRMRPYSWSTLTDCSTVVESVSSYYLQKLSGKNATLAGGDLQGKPRRVAIIAPENSWYQECVNSGIKVIEKAGRKSEIVMNEPYRIEINDLLNQAVSIVAKLKSSGATTVICGCDPILLAYMTNQASTQHYDPEWVETGVAYTDLDIVGQIMLKEVWKGAFGVSFNGPTVPIRGGPGYRAFKLVRPNEEPSQAADLIFYQMQLLAIGVEMAGPVLTPETFERGMFQYPLRTGPAGTWKFGPGDYTTSQDAREVYYDPNVKSVQNDQPGAWVDPSGGTKRYQIGQFPPGDPPGSG